jgi:Fe-S cluster assembly protein SufD
MLTETSTKQRLKELEDLFSFFQSIDPQGSYKEKAWERFLELGLPDKSDAYQYVPLRSLYENPFAKASEIDISYDVIQSSLYPECKNSCLVFVNGAFSKELSRTEALPKQAIVRPLQEAFRSYGSFLQARFAKSLKEESDPFAALNLALFQKGAFLFIPPKMEIEVPIQCLHVLQGKEGVLQIISPRMHLFLGQQAKVEWISSTCVLSDDAFFHNPFMDVVLEQGAQFSSLYVTSALPKKAWHFESVRAAQKRDSTFHSLCASQGAKSVRHDFRIALTEENASCDLQGISLLKDSDQSHAHICVEHLAPHTRSMQRFKKVLTGHSQSSFQGKIHVAKEAQKTEAYQLNNNLILADRAIANSKPGLEIFADDVKASHGATIAQLDPSHLFYLKSRGLSESQAKSLLVLGFCQELFQPISIVSVREHLFSLSQQYMQGEK